ncbi:MAG: AAA family ATPase [Desulfobacterales bacterium]|nr:MAG: AAA family ATPase [Desulfobacterales bacterium]
MKKNIQNHFSGNFVTFYGKYLPNFQKIGGDEFKVICPFHEDKKPSFNFDNNSGKFYCFGCGKKGDIFHFYAKINGMDTRRDFGKVLKGIADDFGIPWEQQKPKMVKAYDYTNTNGDLIFQVCRMEPKDFRQRRPDGKGGFIWNLKGIDPVIYRLPEVVKADEILIVEGEKDCDNLAKLVFAATCNPMGAKKWRNKYGEYLKGKRVVLIPDNDNEGKEHMAQVGASLKGQTANLKLIQLPGLPSKGDVSDFISGFKSTEEAAERLSILIENAKPYQPPKTYTIEDAILTTKQVCELPIATRKCYLHPWLKEDSINLITGWAGYGKTWFAQGIADSVTKGEPFGPWECEVSVPVLFLDGEMSLQDTQERIFSLMLNTERENRFYFYSDAYANQLGLQRAHLANEKWRSKIKQILTTRKIKLFIIDNLASLASGLDENSKKDYDPINQWFLELRFAGISTLMLHHTNKDGGQRGTSAREDNIDISILLKRPNDYVTEDGARFIASFKKQRVSTKYLHLISNIEFKLIEDESKYHIWTYRNVKAETKREVLKLLDEGLEQKFIAETLGVSKGRVSQIVKQAKKDGHISAKGRLTQSAFTEFSE